MVTTYFFHYTNLNINVNRTTITNIQENVEQTFDYWLYWTQNYIFKSVCGDRIFAAKEGSGDRMGTSASSSSRYLFSLTWPMSGYLLQTTRFRGPSAQSAGGHPWVQDACQRIAGKIADPIADSSLGSHNDVTAAGNPCNQSPGAATQSPLLHGDQTRSRPPGRAFFTLRFLQGNNEMWHFYLTYPDLWSEIFYYFTFTK